MVVSPPRLPLKYRRKTPLSPGPPSLFHLEQSPQSMAYHRRTSSVSIPSSDDVPPLSASGRSSSPFSSPTRYLQTPEPPSSPSMDPLVMSSPKATWNDFTLHRLGVHPHLGRRPSNAYEDHLMSDFDADDIDITRHVKQELDDSSPMQKSCNPPTSTFAGELAIASALLDFSREVRISPTDSISHPPSVPGPHPLSSALASPIAHTTAHIVCEDEHAIAIDHHEAKQASVPEMKLEGVGRDCRSIDPVVKHSPIRTYHDDVMQHDHHAADPSPIYTTPKRMSLAHICSSPLTPCSPSPSKLDPPTSPVVSGPSHVVDTPFDSITTFTTNPSSLESPAISKVSQDVPKLKLPLLSIPTNALPSASSSRSASSASSSRSASPAVSIASGSKRRSFTPETRCVSHAKSEGNPRVVKRDGAQHVRKRDIDGAHVDKKMKTHKRPHHVTVSRPSSPTPSDVSSSTQKPRKKRSKKENLDSHGQSSELPAQIATSVSAPVDNNTLSPSDPPPPLAEEDADAVAKRDMRGFLIQAMAISRASSMPASSLLREVLREQPQVGAQRTKKAWLVLLSEVLSASEVFGRIEREGTDAAGKPLEPQWFYIPEKDDDQERAMLLREMMPKKRNETKKHKQYYYRPVEKISRWDAEDEP